MKNLSKLILILFCSSAYAQEPTTFDILDTLNGDYILKYELTSYDVLNSYEMINPFINTISKPELIKEKQIDKQTDLFDYLIPLNDLNYSYQSIREANLEQNITNYTIDFNMEVWRSIERYIQKLAVKFNKVEVVTGKFDLDGKYFKILTVDSIGIGFVVGTEYDKKSWQDYGVPVRTITSSIATLKYNTIVIWN